MTVSGAAPEAENIERVPVAVIGCGDVSRNQYIPYLLGSPLVRIVCCADQDSDRARSVAAQLGIQARSVSDAIASDDVELVLDLTPPLAHVQVNSSALAAGKHVYTEKPLAATFEEGQDLVDQAARHGRRIASAPDTILGPNLQLARALLDRGKIGTPYMVSMSFVTADRTWHPNPQFFYRPGAGPIFDEGPYFVAALAALLSPVAEVSAMAETFIQGVPGGKDGKHFRPEVPTSYVGSLRLHSGVLASLLMSFDVRGSTMPPMEIYGSRGTLRLKFPGHYRGSVIFGREHDAITEEIDPGWRTYPMEDTKIRGLGVEEFAVALRTGRPSRLEGLFALHVLEVMEAIVRSAAEGQPIRVTTEVSRPAPYDPRENPRNQILDPHRFSREERGADPLRAGSEGSPQ